MPRPPWSFLLLAPRDTNASLQEEKGGVGNITIGGGAQEGGGCDILGRSSRGHEGGGVIYRGGAQEGSAWWERHIYKKYKVLLITLNHTRIAKKN